MIGGWIIALLVMLVVIWFSTKYPWWQPSVDLSYPRILMYHMVREHIPGARFNGLRVKPAAFERQLKWLVENGWRFRFLSEVVDDPDLDEKTVVITFDDGYADNFHTVLPLLEKHDARATLFLVEQRFDNDWAVKKKAHHSGGELMREPKLSDQQVRQMLDSGRFEIGGHSITHADFSKLSSQEKLLELSQSRRSLMDTFDTPVDSYAYTFGIYDAEDKALVEQLGYHCAVTTEEGVSENLEAERYTLKRVKVAGKKDFLRFRLSLRLGLLRALR